MYRVLEWLLNNFPVNYNILSYSRLIWYQINIKEIDTAQASKCGSDKASPEGVKMTSTEKSALSSDLLHVLQIQH